MRDEVKKYISFVGCRFRTCPHRFAKFTCTQSCTQTCFLMEPAPSRNRKRLLQVRVSRWQNSGGPAVADLWLHGPLTNRMVSPAIRMVDVLGARNGAAFGRAQPFSPHLDENATTTPVDWKIGIASWTSATGAPSATRLLVRSEDRYPRKSLRRPVHLGVNS